MKRRSFSLCARGRILNLGTATQLMGIVNCTPDSFSGDGKHRTEACLRHARKLIRQGADIVDVGGESTRPGARPISVQEEMRRVIPVIEALGRRIQIPISVDTSKMEVARRALDAGAAIINNIQGNQLTKSFLTMVRDYDAALVVMHMRGRPASMQNYATYKDVVREVIEELKISVEKCLGVGIKKDRIVIDPGIGFAKTAQQNLVLIHHLSRLNVLGCPIMLGTSRKSFIGQVLQKPLKERLLGTSATVVAGVLQGAHIVRVHDVKAIKETLTMTDAILNAQF